MEGQTKLVNHKRKAKKKDWVSHGGQHKRTTRYLWGESKNDGVIHEKKAKKKKHEVNHREKARKMG